MDNFTELSVSITKKLSKDTKKSNGIFFTSNNTVKKCIDLIGNIVIGNKVLEPGCGSCQFIHQLGEKFEITGIEKNELIFNDISGVISGNNIKLINGDFLEWETNDKFNLIIGNPPYYTMKSKSDEYKAYYNGRANIYILFIIKSLKLLAKNGVLCFILPKNFLNCLYYDKLRKHIYKNYKIIDISTTEDDYIETKQEMIIFTIQNTDFTSNDDFTIIVNNYIVFNTKYNIKLLENLYKKSNFLVNMGFTASIGSVVWNENKEILTDDFTKTRLIYSSDINDGKLHLTKYNNIYKKNYINKEGINDLLLVINRGYGNGKYKFNYCLIDTDERFLIENHLICLKYNESLDRKSLKKIYNVIIHSFKYEKTLKFIELYFGNNAINMTELLNVLPIYEDLT